MPLMLLDVGLDLYAEVPLAPEFSDVLTKQWDRLPDDAAKDAFAARIAARLGPIITDCVDWDLKPPSPAQVTYATALARQLGIDIPRDVLRFRNAMNEFLDTHGASARRRPDKRIESK